MIYKIIVDKQPMTNPSSEKREYDIDIEELRYKGSVYDSLVITADEDYVMRRLELTEFHVLNVLETPIKQPLNDINIELFEGENYIYLYEMEGNRLVGKYLVDNEFNKLYVTRSEMNSSITQSVNAIELSVNAQLEGIDGELTDIQGKLELKIDKNDNDQVVSMINASADEITLTSNRLIIDSTNFKLNDEGNITATGGDIGGFTLGAEKFEGELSGLYDYNYYDAMIALGMVWSSTGWLKQEPITYDIEDANSTGSVNVGDVRKIITILNGTGTNTKNISGKFTLNTTDPKNSILIEKDNQTAVSIGTGGINSNMITTQNLICGRIDDALRFFGLMINGDNGQISIIGTIDQTEGGVSHTVGTQISVDGITTQGDITSATKVTSPVFEVAGYGYCMNGTATDHTYKCNWTGGALHFYVDNTDVGNISDKRLKTDIKEVDEDLIKAIGELDYKQFKKDNRNGLISVGIIAQDLIEILKKYNKEPKDYELLEEFQYNLDKDKLYYKIDYEQFLLLRLMAKELEIKEQQKTIKDLISRVEKLEKGDK